MRKNLLITALTLLTCGAKSIVTIAGGGSDDGRPAREAAISPAVVSAVGVSTDNATWDTRHHLFSPTGGVPSTGVVRISTVRQVDPPPAVKRRRAARP